MNGLTLKPDLEQAERRWLAFWEHAIIDRPCCMICAPRSGVQPVSAPPYLAGAREDEAERTLAWLAANT